MQVVDDKFVKALFGSPVGSGENVSWPTAYMLLYESEDIILQ